jgi:predicted Rossmann fold nucleotide-binding protein DprA/Smf involved in DNA uptake
MPCVGPDGKLSGSGQEMLKAVEEGATANQVAASTGLPLFLVRSGLRELAAAGLVVESDGSYSQTEAGAAKLS